jgi:hypothetical protein
VPFFILTLAFFLAPLAPVPFPSQPTKRKAESSSDSSDSSSEEEVKKPAPKVSAKTAAPPVRTFVRRTPVRGPPRSSSCCALEQLLRAHETRAP